MSARWSEELPAATTHQNSVRPAQKLVPPAPLTRRFTRRPQQVRAGREAHGVGGGGDKGPADQGGVEPGGAMAPQCGEVDHDHRPYGNLSGTGRRDSLSGPEHLRPLPQRRPRR